jgi:hypothetical protein
MGEDQIARAMIEYEHMHRDGARPAAVASADANDVPDAPAPTTAAAS